MKHPIQKVTAVGVVAGSIAGLVYLLTGHRAMPRQPCLPPEPVVREPPLPRGNYR